MAGIIVGVITISITILLALIPVIIKLLKWSGLWVTAIYIIILLLLQNIIMKNTNGVTPMWCYIGLYGCLGISGILLIKNLFTVFKNIISRLFHIIRGY